MNTATVPSSPASVSAEDKTTAIVAYLTLIGFIAAVVIHGTKKTRLGAYHLRQSLGLLLTSIAVAVAGMILAFIPFLGWLADLALWLGVFVLWILGFVAALKGEFKAVPILGENYQKWFGSAFE
ncbi:hypothetical protein DB347_05430 [Opitutaceae bacterium EW11]|nr:hypothetical protein DB347_05430 [Opitutaceae bacterium EW11]